jgi:ribosomal protein S19E (S16A)
MLQELSSERRRALKAVAKDGPGAVSPEELKDLLKLGLVEHVDVTTVLTGDGRVVAQWC